MMNYYDLVGNIVDDITAIFIAVPLGIIFIKYCLSYVIRSAVGFVDPDEGSDNNEN